MYEALKYHKIITIKGKLRKQVEIIQAQRTHYLVQIQKCLELKRVRKAGCMLSILLKL